MAKHDEVDDDTATYMHIGTANTKRVHADTLVAITWPWHGLHGYNQIGILPRNYTVRIKFRWILSYLLAGLGLWNLMFGMIVLCSRDNTAFAMLVRAEAPSLCPKFGLTYISC